MAFPADDAATLVELEAMYDEAANQKKGDGQLLAILAKAIIELKTIAAADSNFEWPVTP